MKVQRTEIIMLKGRNLKEAQHWCHLAKNLYNAANYEMRQSFIAGNRKGNYIISTEFAKNNQPDYRALPAQCSQQIINLLEKNWKSFFKSIKDWKKNPKKYKGRPKLPKYKDKDGCFPILFTKQSFGKKFDYLKFPKVMKFKIKTRIPLEQIKQVRIIPEATCFKCEIVYEKEIVKNENLKFENKMSIDLGVNNLATMYSNVDGKSFIMNGKPLKSINQFYNKKLAELKSLVGKSSSKRIKNFTKRRNFKVKDYLHKASRLIVNLCIQNNIGHLIVGHNKNWKQEVNIGSRNNQHFVGIPFSMLQNQLKYKCEEVGIIYQETEESYTSKCDHLANEEMKHHEKYLGKRIHRGLFQSSTGKIINADVNGAIGIMRKVINDDAWRPVDRVVALNPVKMNVPYGTKNLTKSFSV